MGQPSINVLFLSQRPEAPDEGDLKTIRGYLHGVLMRIASVAASSEDMSEIRNGVDNFVHSGMTTARQRGHYVQTGNDGRWEYITHDLEGVDVRRQVMCVLEVAAQLLHTAGSFVPALSGQDKNAIKRLAGEIRRQSSGSNAHATA